MTDLEITRLCAEAMGYRFNSVNPHAPGILVTGIVDDVSRYAPLHDDAQAMALLKKIEISIDCESLPDVWIARHESNIECRNTDLNRAICECVVRTQAAK